ncbi:hypothetical protein C8R45DRAFT_1187049 [Mycena sanguinolenta]|nr:hypothetical protein C8R45DRAFT_1187049 [Mycena sanguinolenta]
MAFSNSDPLKLRLSLSGQVNPDLSSWVNNMNRAARSLRTSFLRKNTSCHAGVSQYQQGGVSACELAAHTFVRVVPGKVEEGLEGLEDKMRDLDQTVSSLALLQDFPSQSAVVITRSPEIITCFKLHISTAAGIQNVFIIFRRQSIHMVPASYSTPPSTPPRVVWPRLADLFPLGHFFVIKDDATSGVDLDSTMSAVLEARDSNSRNSSLSRVNLRLNGLDGRQAGVRRE